jgi:hypothetical protein
MIVDSRLRGNDAFMGNEVSKGKAGVHTYFDS